MTECAVCAEQAWEREYHHCVLCHRGFWSRKVFGLHRAEDGTCRNPARSPGFWAVGTECGPVWRHGAQPSALPARGRYVPGRRSIRGTAARSAMSATATHTRREVNGDG
jgi:hypothetical protein